MAELLEKKLPTILNHYILPDNLEGVFKGKCKHCSKSISGTIKVTTNLLKHMVSYTTCFALSYCFENIYYFFREIATQIFLCNSPRRVRWRMIRQLSPISLIEQRNMWQKILTRSISQKVWCLSSLKISSRFQL